MRTRWWTRNSGGPGLFGNRNLLFYGGISSDEGAGRRVLKHDSLAGIEGSSGVKMITESPGVRLRMAERQAWGSFWSSAGKLWNEESSP